ncbi:MAG: glycosyltransferase family 2 protein [bacterium]
MKIIAVMPAYNESTRIAAAISGVRPFVHSVVVVDDGSRDTTASVARSAGARVLVHRLNRGQGAALKTGNAAALRLGADIVVHIDADGQHDPSYIPVAVEPILKKEVDVVYGSRYMGIDASGIPASRRFLHFGIRRFNALALGIPSRMTDPQSGFRVMTADAVRKLNFFQDRMAHCSELMSKVTHSDLRWKEVPVRVKYTAESLAKGNKALDSFKIVWQLILGGRD